LWSFESVSIVAEFNQIFKFKIVKRAFLLAVNSITQTSPELISTTIVGF